LASVEEFMIRREGKTQSQWGGQKPVGGSAIGRNLLMLTNKKGKEIKGGKKVGLRGVLVPSHNFEFFHK